MKFVLIEIGGYEDMVLCFVFFGKEGEDCMFDMFNIIIVLVFFVFGIVFFF